MKISGTLAAAASGIGVLAIGGGIAAAAALSGGNAPSDQVPAGDQVTQSSSVTPTVAPTVTSSAVSSPVAIPTVRSLTKHATVKQQEVTVSEPSTSQDTTQPTTADSSTPNDSGIPAHHHGPTYTGPVVNDPYGSLTNSPSASPQE